MSRQVPWNRTILEEYIAEAKLTDIEERVIRARIEKGWSREKTAQEIHCSVSTVDRVIKRLKQKYDSAANYDILLPRRAKSSKYINY